MYAKIENDVLIFPPKNSGNMMNVDKNIQWLTENGYTDMSAEEIAQYSKTDPEPRKYSTLKIIRTLGAEWETYRKQLEEAGVIDQFFAANYLAENDPVFVAFMQTVPDDLQDKLSDCIWDPT